MAAFQFVTKDMIPREWGLSPQQEKVFLQESAAIHKEPPDGLERMVAVELPDTFTAWAYQEAYVEAAKVRADLVPPVITSEDQWRDRPDELAKVVTCLWDREPPAVAFVAFAVKKQREGSSP